MIGRELRSHVDPRGALTLSLEGIKIRDPAPDEVVVRVEAAPINPSDLRVMLGPVDLSSGRPGDPIQGAALAFSVPPERMAEVNGRIGLSLPVGYEAAGTVVEAGRDVRSLLGRTVSLCGGAMYADYRVIKASEVMSIPEGVDAADAAAMTVNPLTALGLVETARRSGHKAIVHTAAASTLGQMLQRVCAADDIPLINIVRSSEQAELLRKAGAVHILNSKDPEFSSQLVELCAVTGATVAFDAIGGGPLGGEILLAMEQACCRLAEEYSPYGSRVFKQLYVYGAMDPRPITLSRIGLGYDWSVSGWLLFPFLQSLGNERVNELKRRVLDELQTTFVTKYAATIGLSDLLDPETLINIHKRTTGEKYLLSPTLDAS